MSEIKVPEMGESITEGTVSKWVVKEGDTVSQGDVLLELETDKVNLEISAEEDGVVESITKQEGETVQVGESVGVIGAGSGSSKPAASESKPAPESKPESKSDDVVTINYPAKGAEPAAEKATDKSTNAVTSKPDNGDAIGTPAARKLARERGIDLGSVQSNDPIGRVNPDDVRKHGDKPAPAKSEAAPAKKPVENNPAKPADRQPMSRRRRTIANRLVEAQHNAAMLTTFNEVDMTAILDVRKRRKDAFKEKYDVGLGFMSFFTKAVVGALKKFPMVNAEIDGDDVIVKKFYDIGIAVSAKEGLVVPVVRDADRLGFAQIEKEIATLASKARSNTLGLSELQGGTFTITNGGVFGSLLSTPILNAPQVAILGMHKIQLRPVAIDAERMENRPMMYIALSYDHRIIDGSEAVSFLVKVKELLEDPETLLIEG
ncbi:2-oxoglutarate dehydrogenase complex dihydrolipoyllysine-residue succinyltransferase [Paenibacillus sp. PK4536]|uniref:2-oxoglutarate dehydrogenase complex dihydrolipoyllysine-residue succinyltransferase n=1 Tax=unclassified Paenibacillus TaxID=185978 RepID=UPI0010BFF278|nr:MULTISPECIES: 2-oxoglutarate dehydrogenase complex dihydrolipoyllysine-residue succinyltransferase [unclassified Paenibacillus]TKJ91659.1 dihydrolipoyllysine-residue succinyltransferase [Paenibacillus sp. CFBP13512]WIM37893.1 2-oxoglutarate dehydrogenase complex dihydrolipoyllysine-residue succinyltransferase [Paenibacillus sp. PK4536]